MKEFWFWVAIVTLIIACIMVLSFLLMHTNKQLKRSDEQLNKANALVQRLEEREKLTQLKEK
jgi:Flp pilus assembly protein TadB